MVHLSSRFQRSKKSSPAVTASPSPTPPTTATTNLINRESPPVLSITTTPPSSSHSNHETASLHLPKSPFRAFHFRSSNKRGRSPAPPKLPAVSTPARPATAVAVAQHDKKIFSPKPKPSLTIPAMSDDTTSSRPPSAVGHHPNLPAFLALSQQEIDEKFEDIQAQDVARGLPSRPASPSARFAKITDPQMRALDRYNNIQPWLNNRIKLKVSEGQVDYVNASPIVLNSPLNPDDRHPHRYIAMQGPTCNTTPHVWRMVAEQLESPAVIVMLTTTHELGHEKCFQYFPSSTDDAPLEIGAPADTTDLTDEEGASPEPPSDFRATVACTSVEERAEGAIELRRLNIHVEGVEEDKTVWHLFYRRWPDFGVPNPEDYESFFELMQLSRELNASEENPRIIHCSAGVGRTGTFMTLEHLIREIDSGDLEHYNEKHTQDLVHDTVNSLREQRRLMVQAEPQYAFIYEVLQKRWMDKHGSTEETGEEPAAKRIELDHDPFVED